MNEFNPNTLTPDPTNSYGSIWTNSGTVINVPFITKDSGARKEMANWFVRDDDWTKLRYDLIPLDMLERLAWLYTRGAVKYWDWNRQNAVGDDLQSFKRSAWRHFIQWMKGDIDEDHAIAVCWNIFAYEHLNSKIVNDDTTTTYN